MNKEFSLFLIASAALFSSAFYFRLNLGGEGLFLPFNSVVWIVMASVILLAAWQMLKQQVIKIPPFFNLFIMMLLSVLLAGGVVGLQYPLSWVLRISAIVLGFLLFISLFQFNVSRRTIHNALYILCGAFTLHALVGVLQLFPGSLLSKFIPHAGTQVPIGIFQQPNLQATLMVTAVVLSMYLLSSPDFRNRLMWMKLLLLSCLLLSSFILMSSGSRVGLVAGIMSVTLMLVSRFRALKYRRAWVMAMFVVLLAGSSAGFIANDGALRAYSKMEKLSNGGQDIRKDVYLISWNVIKDKPFFGHGIGSFQRVFHEKAAEYQMKTPGFNLGVRFNHPHNEFLLWGVENGVVGILALTFGVVAVVFQLLRLGWQRGGGMAALLLPIALHTQVEHPFYVSAYHWVVFIFLLFLTFQSGCKTYLLRITLAANWLIKGVSAMLLTVIIWFCGTSLFYSYRIAYIYNWGNGDVAELVRISQHPYFSDIATRYIFATLSTTERVSQRTAISLDYVAWMEAYLKRKPDIGVFVDLIGTYAYLGDFEKAKVAINRAFYLYRDNPLILKASKEVLLTEKRE
jgi:O-antigen polymerase